MARKKAAKKPAVTLTARQEAFAQHFAATGHATKAAIEAGYSPATGGEQGSRLLKNVGVAARIKELQAEAMLRLHITKDMVLREWWAIVQADPNELTQVRRGSCRHCWGDGFLYQWKEGEWEYACEQAVLMEKPLPDEKGGMGYDEKRPPHPDCPECAGEGVLRTFFADTRNLSPAGKALFAGVQETSQGLKINMHSKVEALKEVGKLLGFYETKGGDHLGVTQNNTFIQNNSTTNVALEKAERDLVEAFGRLVEGTVAEKPDGSD